MSRLERQVAGPMACASSAGIECSQHGPGHALPAIQARVVAATPSKWRDGVVSHRGSDGWLGVDLLGTGETAWVWHHGDVTASAPIGEPVALHSLYNTLALGRERINVLVASPVA